MIACRLLHYLYGAPRSFPTSSSVFKLRRRTTFTWRTTWLQLKSFDNYVSNPGNCAYRHNDNDKTKRKVKTWMEEKEEKETSRRLNRRHSSDEKMTEWVKLPTRGRVVSLLAFDFVCECVGLWFSKRETSRACSYQVSLSVRCVICYPRTHPKLRKGKTRFLQLSQFCSNFAFPTSNRD